MRDHRRSEMSDEELARWVHIHRKVIDDLRMQLWSIEKQIQSRMDVLLADRREATKRGLDL